MLWDIFCRVIDNYGDIGVCWRLCADLAARGHSVRLWVDDASALQWMAPGAVQGQWPQVQVLPWELSSDTPTLQHLPAADVWVEAFGCEIAPALVAHFAQRVPPERPVWINLEYLSAEPYVERSHGLPSPVMQGPARGWTKYFFYPGFTEKTGGLLREPGLADAVQKLHAEVREELWVSLFCYEPPLLQALLSQWAASPTRVRLRVTSGRATHAVQALLGARVELGSLRVDYLPTLSQPDFDALLRQCDINFVRGEDSVVRALWAGKPFVWHIYPQEDQAHGAKLEAFLAQMQLDASVCTLHRAWNGLLPPTAGAAALQALATKTLPQWQSAVEAARTRLLKMDDLGQQLIQFVLKNR